MAKTVLGIRAEPSCLHWAVVIGTRSVPSLIANDTLSAPVNYEPASAFVWYRARVQEVIDKYAVEELAVRTQETVARVNRTHLAARARVEAIVMEAAAAKGLRVSTAMLATISSGLKSKSAKRYLEADELRGLDWRGLSAKQREAVLVAASIL